VKKLTKPKNEVELAFIKSLLESEGIPFHVLNDHFGSMNVGVQIEQINRKTVMVLEDDFDRARELIEGFRETVLEVEPADTAKKLSVTDRVRVILEALLFFWYVPGKRRKHDELDD